VKKLKQRKFWEGSIGEAKIVRINTATIEQLDILSGIGPALTVRIIDYRGTNGGFKNIEELKLVFGIGDKLFEKIKDDVGL
jgi:competence protein ComEA